MKLFDGRNEFYQYDTNQKLICDSCSVGEEIHFSNDFYSKAAILKTYEFEGSIVVDVPNLYLLTSGELVVYRTRIDDDSRSTTEEFVFTIKPRKRPSDYVYTETDVMSYYVLEQRVKKFEEDAESGKFNGKDGKDGKDGSIALADFYDEEKTYDVGEVCSYGGLLYKCVIPITTPEKFNRDKWQQTKLFGFSLWRYIVDNHRYIMKDNKPTLEYNIAYHAMCAAVPCKKGDVFYYTGQAHHTGLNAVRSWWVLDSDWNIISASTYKAVPLKNKRVEIKLDNAAMVLFNFCISNTGEEDTYEYGLEMDGFTPIRGRDYWTAEDINEVKAYIDDTVTKATPSKGTDYWTEEDKAEIKQYVDDAILGGEW